MHLTLRQIQYFVAMVDAGSMTRAAEVLNVAPTGLSMQLKAIEDGFGVVLFKRHSRGVVPTEAGLAFLNHARWILRQVKVAELLLSPRAEPQRTLRLGLPPALIRLLGPGVLSCVAERMAGHSLQVYEGRSRDLERRLQAREIDIIVGYVEQGLAGLLVLPLAEDSLVFVEATRPGGATGPISIAEVLSTNMVFYGEKSVAWKALHTRALQDGLPVVEARQVESVDIWRHLICRGGYTSVTSVGAVIDEVERGEVSIRELGDRQIVLFIGLAIREDDAIELWAKAMLKVVTGLLDSQLPCARNHLRRGIDGA
jgi:LysR family tcuABC transcriptional regulator